MAKKEYAPSELARQMMAYLDCPCEPFPSMEDDDPIAEAFAEAKREGKTVGYAPVLVKVDEILWEMLTVNADEENEPDFDIEHVRAYRQKMLSSDLPDAGQLLNSLLDERREEMEEGDFDWDEEVMGEIAGGEAVEHFSSYWNFETGFTDEVILAKIPVPHPWQVFAYLPMGNWNDCPDTLELMSVAKSWYETYGALPSAVSHDELEFSLEAPITDSADAQKLALEHYAFCPDRVEQCGENCTVGELADTLTKSVVWYFWWD